MIIREATRFDFEILVGMVNDYGNAMKHPLARIGANDGDTKQIFEEIRAGRGLTLIAQDGNSVVGCIAGLIVNNIWNHRLLVMHEIIYWVKPERRGSKAGYLLLLEYAEKAQRMIDCGRIHSATLINMEGSNVDYGRFGFKRFHEEWVI